MNNANSQSHLSPCKDDGRSPRKAHGYLLRRCPRESAGGSEALWNDRTFAWSHAQARCHGWTDTPPPS